MIGGTIVFREFDNKYYIDCTNDGHTTTRKLSGFDDALRLIKMVNSMIKRYPVGRISHISDVVVYTNVTKKMADILIGVAGN